MNPELHHLTVTMPDGKTRSIEALWVQGIGCRPSDRTVILYHGNAMNMWGMIEHAKKYREAGFNVLVTTIGGKQYGQIEPEGSNNDSIETSELSMYADVDAEMAFLKDQKQVKEVGVHGLSIGGTKAFQAAQKYNDTVKFVVAEQTLTTAADVASNVAENVAWAGNIGRALGRAAAPLGMYDSANGNQSNGFDNKDKALFLRNTDVQLLAIAAKKDDLMGRNKKHGVYEHNFAEDLLKARYGNDSSKKPLWIEGGHSARIDDDTFDKIVQFANESCPR